jgi:SPP1 family predicted phage head-tail adaptor
MRAGRLRHKIAVLEEIEVLDSNSGEVLLSWIETASVYGSIEPQSGKEYIQAQATQSDALVNVVIRYIPSITTKHRLSCNGKQYNIRSVLDRDERGKELNLVCSQRD